MQNEQKASLSPEERLLRELVNPLTVVDVSEGLTRLYRIETGERRYWAAWLLRDFVSGYDGDGMIELENFMVLETQIIDRGENAGALTSGEAPHYVRRVVVRGSKKLKKSLKLTIL